MSSEYLAPHDTQVRLHHLLQLLLVTLTRLCLFILILLMGLQLLQTTQALQAGLPKMHLVTTMIGQLTI
jgi:hypothetical protein